MQISIDAYRPRKIIGRVCFRSGIKAPLCREDFDLMLPFAEGSNNMASF